MIEHHIQKDILLRLSKAPSLRFSELKPDDMESNLFMYHLKQLITGGYVMQDDDKLYALTAAGLGYVDTLTLTTGKPRKQSKLISILALKNANGEYLLAKRLLQPSINTWMIPSGKQHFGESPEKHVAREAEEQFGTDLELKRRGLFDIRITHDDTLVSHLTAHVYSGDYDGSAPEQSKKFEYKWLVPQEQPLTPGTLELIEKLENETNLFFLSLDVRAD